MNLLTKKTQPVVIDLKTSNDKTTHDFVRGLIRKGIVDIIPQFDKAGIKYLDAEDYYKNYDLSMMTSTLESLVLQGVLKENGVSRILTCPSCGSPEVHSKFTCPRCASDEVGRTQLLEHKECGYIGARKDFLKEESMVCPRCDSVLSQEGADYRSIGDFYHCEKCFNRFDRPEVIHFCLNCDKVSTFQDIKYIKVSSYRVSDDILSELTSEFPLLENLSVFLENRGFHVKLHDKITGVSGTPSNFDLVAEKDKIRIVIDVSISGKKSDVVAFLAKKIDVNPTKALILDLSGGNELAVLSKIYGIDVFGIGVMDAQIDQGVPKDFESFIDNLINDSKVRQPER